MNYHLKKLIPGVSVKPELKGKVLVAVPAKYTPPIRVVYKNQFMVVNHDPPLVQIAHDDLFRVGETHLLSYYEWKPVSPENMFGGNGGL